MSKAYDKGFDLGVDSYEALKAHEWVSEAHARGYIAGLEAHIENAIDSIGDWGKEKSEEVIKEREEDIRKTEILIDQIIGSKDHKNTIQKMTREIEELKLRIEELES